MALQPAERETVFLTSDEEKYFIIQTSQRKFVTQLEKNAAAEILEDFKFEGTRFLRVKLPLNAVGFRYPAGKREVEAKRVMKANRCKGTRADGNPCQAIAQKDTGYCRKHSP